MLRGITFDPILIYCFDAPDLLTAFDITGWTPWAEVRTAPDQALILDLQPQITDAPNGIVTIPSIEDANTAVLPEGKYKWDFILEDPSGQRLGPYVKGSFLIQSKITQGQPPEG